MLDVVGGAPSCLMQSIAIRTYPIISRHIQTIVIHCKMSNYFPKVSELSNYFPKVSKTSREGVQYLQNPRGGGNLFLHPDIEPKEGPPPSPDCNFEIVFWWNIALPLDSFAHFSIFRGGGTPFASRKWVQRGSGDSFFVKYCTPFRFVCHFWELIAPKSQQTSWERVQYLAKNYVKIGIIRRRPAGGLPDFTSEFDFTSQVIRIL